jgi:hypothetical protein
VFRLLPSCCARALLLVFAHPSPGRGACFFGRDSQRAAMRVSRKVGRCSSFDRLSDERNPSPLRSDVAGSHRHGHRHALFVTRAMRHGQERLTRFRWLAVTHAPHATRIATNSHSADESPRSIR